MKKPLPDAALETPGALDLSDEDILSAMKEMGGKDNAPGRGHGHRRHAPS